MYTVEMESDYASIVVLDEQARHEDVEIYIGDDGVVIMRQFSEKINKYSVMVLSFQQYMDMVAAVQSPEGMFKLEVKRGK